MRPSQYYDHKRLHYLSSLLRLSLITDYEFNYREKTYTVFATICLEELKCFFSIKGIVIVMFEFSFLNGTFHAGFLCFTSDVLFSTKVKWHSRRVLWKYNTAPNQSSTRIFHLLILTFHLRENMYRIIPNNDID